MKIRKYYLVFEGERLAATFDAYEDNKKIKELLKVCKLSGWTVKEVSENEYEKEKQIAEEKELKEIFE